MGHGTDSADLDILSALLSDSSPRKRAIAYSALVRRNPENALSTLNQLATDEDWHVRRRIAELAIDLGRNSTNALLSLTDDKNDLVREMACFALGELYENASEENIDITPIVELLISNFHHDDPLVRESAIAALGNIGDERSRETVIAACSDKAPIRRRAVVALSAFVGDDVDAALDTALNDHDWQVRQAAEDISGKKSPKE